MFFVMVAKFNAIVVIHNRSGCAYSISSTHLAVKLGKDFPSYPKKRHPSDRPSARDWLSPRPPAPSQVHNPPQSQPHSVFLQPQQSLQPTLNATMRTSSHGRSDPYLLVPQDIVPIGLPLLPRGLEGGRGEVGGDGACWVSYVKREGRFLEGSPPFKQPTFYTALGIFRCLEI